MSQQMIEQLNMEIGALKAKVRDANENTKQFEAMYEAQLALNRELGERALSVEAFKEQLDFQKKIILHLMESR